MKFWRSDGWRVLAKLWWLMLLAPPPPHGGVIAYGKCLACSKGSSVCGTVVLEDGTPLAGGFIGFQSEGPAAESVNARGSVGEDGTFVLSTFGEEDGVVAGKHRVLVRGQRQKFNNGQEKWDVIPEPVIHPRFRNYETSGLEFTVAEGDNEFTVEVERPATTQSNR